MAKPLRTFQDDLFLLLSKVGRNYQNLSWSTVKMEAGCDAGCVGGSKRSPGLCVVEANLQGNQWEIICIILEMFMQETSSSPGSVTVYLLRWVIWDMWRENTVTYACSVSPLSVSCCSSSASLLPVVPMFEMYQNTSSCRGAFLSIRSGRHISQVFCWYSSPSIRSLSENCHVNVAASFINSTI